MLASNTLERVIIGLSLIPPLKGKSIVMIDDLVYNL